MLVLSRKAFEVVVIELPDGRRIEITVVQLQKDRDIGYKCRLGFTAPDDVKIFRKELLE